MSKQCRGRWLIVLTSLLTVSQLKAQGSIAGKVTVTSGGTPVAGARVRALTASGTIAGSVLSRDEGTYRIAINNPGFQTYSTDVQVLRNKSITVSHQFK